MNLIRTAAKIALLIFGFLPLIYFALFFTIVGSGKTSSDPLWWVLFCLTAISLPGVYIFYIVHAFKNKIFVKEQRYLWAALLLFGHIFVYPAYWYLYIWRKRSVVPNAQNGNS
jgi:hypothetical protein